MLESFGLESDPWNLGFGPRLGSKFILEPNSVPWMDLGLTLGQVFLNLDPS